MRRSGSRYPRTSYGRSGLARAASGSRSGLTRRGLLGAAIVVSAAGVIDLFRPRHRAAAATKNLGAGLPGHPSTGAPEGSVRPHTGQTGSSGSTTIAGGHHASGHDGAGSHSHHHGESAHGHDHGHATHSHGDAPPHHHGTSDEPSDALRRQERVKLPPAKVRVRSRPIYSIADIDPHPPKRAIALTVDDGPDPLYTPKVLHLLEKYRMQASFCIVGVHADSYPKLIRDIHRAGHVIVNHSYTHIQPFNLQTEKRIVAEITRTQRAIEKATGVTPELFRAPGGAWNHFIFRAVAAYGLTPLDWDVDPMDWARPGTTYIERAMLKGRPGDIVLCHDGGGNRIETVRALRKVLPTWKHRGYTTIPLVVPERAKRIHHSDTTPTPTASPSITPSESASGTPSP